MAGNPNAGQRSATVQQALSVVDLGRQASTAYERSDLDQRLALTRRRLADPAFHVFVIGEFKQGKSSLVNALLNAPVCPVDDDIATSVPTAIRFGDPPAAAVLFDPGGDTADPTREPIREAIAVDQVASYVTESADVGGERRVSSVEVSLPRKLLSDGLVIVDTPGVGGLGSAHSAATIGALPMADAVVFVSDASQEFTGPELEFLQTARRMCPNVVCVLTKIDFYPSWRKIRDLNVEHLKRQGVTADMLCVSSSLRVHALRANDRELNRESGFPELAGYLQNKIAANAEKLSVRAAANDVVAVASMLEGQFRSEREALDNPEEAQRVVDNLTELKAKAERLKSGVSKWQQTLSDGVIDLQADVDHDLRGRLRAVTRQADEALEASDPAETWDEFQAWLYRRVAEDVVHNYTFLHTQAQDLTARVAEHFGEDGADIVVDLDVANPTEVLTSVDANTDLDLTKMGMGSQGLAALRGSYGGLLMFGMLGRMAGLAMANPATIVIGLFMGRSALRGEKERQLNMRRGQARQAHRKYTDEVSFVVGKDSRDTLRRTQRRMRDFFAARAEELHRSTTTALAAAQQAVKSDASTRQKRLRDVEAELKRIAVLRDKAYALAPELKASAGQASATSGASA
ncbi:MAG TPA: dynamin family protein [Acidimicrobiales bacterium]|nr:dynamin family protein [Acidimicrobiales bacterium]